MSQAKGYRATQAFELGEGRGYCPNPTEKGPNLAEIRQALAA